MKKNLQLFIVVLTGSFILNGCSEDDQHIAVPVAPILKEVVLPEINNTMPGQETTVRGKGFSKGDKLFLDGTNDHFEPEVVEVTNDYIRFVVPIEAAGDYEVSILRDEKETILDGYLSVPFVVLLEDVSVPTNVFERGDAVTIEGKGFEAGDVIKLSSEFYSIEKEIPVEINDTEGAINFVLPEDSYGVNQIVVTRGERMTNLGTIKIATIIGDEVGGGIVFWTDSEGVHGLIASKANTGTPTQPFGPAVAFSNAVGTSQALGTGRENTEKLLVQIKNYRDANGGWSDKKSSAELVDELVVTENGSTYEDWYLPSQEELIELFKQNDVMATKGVELPPNNYWSSSEGDGDTAGWAAFYVNFYEPVVVTAIADKEGWLLGIRAIRSF